MRDIKLGSNPDELTSNQRIGLVSVIITVISFFIKVLFKHNNNT